MARIESDNAVGKPLNKFNLRMRAKASQVESRHEKDPLYARW